MNVQRVCAPSARRHGPITLMTVATCAAMIIIAKAQAPPPSQVGEWTSVITWPLVSIHTILTSTGKVLMWDGNQVDGGATAHVWSPSSGLFEAVPLDRSNLFCAGHAALADGRILVVGGQTNTTGLSTTDVNIFNPQTQSWTSAGSMTYRRWYPTVTTLPDGRVLTVSGADTCTSCRVAVPEVYDPAANAWQTLPAAELDIPLYPHLFVLPDGRIGLTSTNEFAVATRILDLASQTWTTIDPRPLDAGSAVMYRPGVVLKTGKSANADPPIAPSLSDAYVIDFNDPSPSWRQIASMGFPRAYHNLTVLPDGTVLASGGGREMDSTNDAGAVLEAEMWSPVTEAWTTMARGARSRLYHSIALLLPDGRVLVSGGGRFVGTNQDNAEIFSPPYLFKGPRPVVSSAPAIVRYGASFPVSTGDAAAIAKVSLIRLGANTHAFDHDQRFVELPFQVGVADLTVQAPASPNIAPPGFYMLFIVNGSGVPSVAAIVQLTSAAGTHTIPPPDPGQSAVASDATVQIGFREPLSSNSVTATSVRLRAVGGTADVPPAVSATGSSIVLAPSALRSASTTYQVTVAGTVTNLAGNALGADDTWSFPTAAPPRAAVNDIVSIPDAADPYFNTAEIQADMMLPVDAPTKEIQADMARPVS